MWEMVSTICQWNRGAVAKVELLLEGQHAQYVQHAGQSGGKLCQEHLT